MKKILLTVVALVFFAFGAARAQDDYVYSDAANDDSFNAFETTVSSYENALLLVVQTYDNLSRQQTIEDIKVTITDKNNKKKKAVKISDKTPFLYVIADYDAFKQKYDFVDANVRKDIMKANPDTVYAVKVDANLEDGREIVVLVTDQKRILSREIGTKFPFSFSADAGTRYSDVINEVDESVDPVF
ncbi:MAG: hypothetical protein FWG57_07615 [Endomicrobia bacterium]|nr:hypothetical protein [Endomicrobiia bacterium]